jgi:hypothetical protein
MIIALAGRYDTATLLPDPKDTGQTAVLEAYGANLAVSASDAETLGAILDQLPTGWTVARPDAEHEQVAWRFAVLRDPDGYRVIQGNGEEQVCVELELAVWLLHTQMRRYVGHHSELIFVHAGVVTHRGRAILLPGHSFAGKSTLVAALVTAGADYYSDEYAVLDQSGRVAQYLEPIQLRGPNGREVVVVGDGRPRDPAPVGLVAITVYTPGASWAPRQLSIAEGIVATMEHAVPARDKPAETLAVLRRALTGAAVVRGDRGEADRTARALLDLLAGSGD